jgi:putative sterol carrier protein
LTDESIKLEDKVAETVAEFFEKLKTVDSTRTAGMRNSYIFDIEGAGRWHVSVDDGSITVSENGGEADCTITTSEESFLKIMRGEQNPTTAYMTGKLKISGDIGAAMKLQKLF